MRAMAKHPFGNWTACWQNQSLQAKPCLELAHWDLLTAKPSNLGKGTLTGRLLKDAAPTIQLQERSTNGERT